MSEKNQLKISKELSLNPTQVKAVADLLDEGATVPFIARYRKEATDSLDEVAILSIRDRLHQLKELDARKEAILKSLDERGLKSPELEKQVYQAETMTKLEDIYLPYKPKRRTRAMMAREKGLEPLALAIWEQEPGLDPAEEAKAFIDEEKEVADADQALAGARDIIAEMINEDQDIRAFMRGFFEKNAEFISRVLTGEEEKGIKYKDYYDWREPALKAPSHRVLAMRRGEKEGFLTLRAIPEQEKAIEELEHRCLKNQSPAALEVRLAVQDCFKRLLGPAMETEIRLATKKAADQEAIKVFAENLRELLMAPALGQKTILAIDPGYRTGCKVVCLSAQGALLHNDIINVLGVKAQEDSKLKLKKLIDEYAINAIAIGNGTASRETEALVRDMGLPADIILEVVNESGASVYSASEVARAEFPDHDVTVRGAVSIGRRLMDPLAELVKIDPKSIGVGQYQHDVDQKGLKGSLEDVVVSCVNAVGVEVNTASAELLSYVSGLGPTLSRNLVNFRDENGPFKSRKELLKVPRLGPKAFQQAAGFLRIAGGDNPLDASAVHPESYPLVEAMAKDLEADILDLLKKSELRQAIRADKYVSDTIGLPTITDILSELEKPGRDPRQKFQTFSFSEGVRELSDLEPGMRLPGIVTNVTNFGAFVDIGVHQDGLVHISQMADHFVRDPYQVVKVHQKVTVKVLEVDLPRKRIGLSMKSDARPGAKAPHKSEPRRKQQRQGGKKQSKGAVPKSSGFNNPFASALAGLKTDNSK